MIDEISSYDEAFYSNQIDGSIRSAEILIPFLLDNIPGISSVVDVGCGTGAWLSVFQKCGIKQISGFDGGRPEGLLRIPTSTFNLVDLESRLLTNQKYDLAMSLEVAEHLTPKRAKTFVSDLCGLSDIVMFGAAVPGQGGTNHINEQWPSYWINLFQELGFHCYDVLRPFMWSNEEIEWWYRQNTFIFINSKRQDISSCIQNLPALPSGMRNCVHPHMFKNAKANFEYFSMRASESNTNPNLAGGWVRAWIQLELASLLSTLGLKADGAALWNQSKQFLTSERPFTQNPSNLSASLQLHVAKLLCTLGQRDIGTLLWNNATNRRTHKELP